MTFLEGQVSGQIFEMDGKSFSVDASKSVIATKKGTAFIVNSKPGGFYTVGKKEFDFIIGTTLGEFIKEYTINKVVYVIFKKSNKFLLTPKENVVVGAKNVKVTVTKINKAKPVVKTVAEVKKEPVLKTANMTLPSKYNNFGSWLKSLFYNTRFNENFAVDGKYLNVDPTIAAIAIQKGVQIIKNVVPVIKKIGSALGIKEDTTVKELTDRFDKQIETVTENRTSVIKGMVINVLKDAKNFKSGIITDQKTGKEIQTKDIIAKLIKKNAPKAEQLGAHIQLQLLKELIKSDPNNYLSAEIDNVTIISKEFPDAKKYFEQNKLIIDNAKSVAAIASQQAKQLAQSQKSTTKTASSTTIKTLPSQYNSFGAWLKSLIKL